MTTDAGIRTMAPDALRRWLAQHDNWQLTFKSGSLWILHHYSHNWAFVSGVTIDEAWDNALQDRDKFDELIIPNYPRDLDVAWSLVLEHCAQGIDGDTEPTAHIEIWTRPDGSVLVFDAWWNTSSSLRKAEDHKVASYPGLTGAVALADALARLAALAIRERG